MKKIILTAIILIGLTIPINGFSVTGGPLVPELASYATVNTSSGPYVDLATGDFNWNQAIMTIPGRGGLNFKLDLSYNAGIKLSQEASWVGLGWHLTPGAIYRTTSHVPDDYYGGVVSTFKKGSGSSYSISALGMNYSWSKSSDGAGGKGFGGNPLGLLAAFSSGLSAAFSYSWWDVADERTYGAYGYMHFGDDVSKYGWDSDCETNCFRRELSKGRRRDGYMNVADLPMDNYMVTGPGPSGRIMPRRNTYILKEDNDNGIEGDANFFFTNHQGGTGNTWIEEGSSAIKIEHTFTEQEHYPYPYNKKLGGFIIKDIDGTQYVYGQPAYIYHDGHVGRYDYTTDDDESKFEISRPYPYAWYLTAILSPDYVNANNNTYEDIAGSQEKRMELTFPYPDDADHGNWLRFDYEKHTDQYLYSDPYVGWKETPLIKPGSRYTRSYGKKDIFYVDKIVSPTHEALFNTQVRYDGRGANATINNAGAGIGAGTLKALSDITLKTRFPSQTTVSKVNFCYDHYLRPNNPNTTLVNQPICDYVPEGMIGIFKPVVQTGALTLNYVFFRGSDGSLDKYFKFDYDGDNPDFEAGKWDKWGYYKRDGVKHDHTLGHIASHHITNACTSEGCDVAAWSLSRITYPLGGELEIKYGVDSFKDRFGNHSWGGGIAVKKLIFNDGLGHFYTRAFNYMDREDLGYIEEPYINWTSGKIGTTAPPPYEGWGDNVVLVSPPNPYTPVEIHYSKVTEWIEPDGGKIIHDYTTGLDDEYSVWNAPSGGPFAFSLGYDLTGNQCGYGQDNATCALYDRSYAWKKPKRTRYFANGGSELLKEENYYYGEHWNRQVSGVHDDTSPLNADEYALWFMFWGNVFLAKKSVEANGVKLTEEFRYHPESELVTEVISYQGDMGPRCSKTKTEYAIDVSPHGSLMFEKNMLSYVSEESTLFTDKDVCWFAEESDYKKLSSSITEYEELSGGRIYPKISKKAISFDSLGNPTNFIVDNTITERDAFGNIKKEIDSNNTEHAYEYWDNRASSVIKSYTIGSNTSSPKSTYYWYTDNRFYSPSSIKTPDDIYVGFGYDNFGRLNSKTDGSGLVTNFSYHIAGNSINSSDLNWIKTESFIDGSNRRSVSYVDGLGRGIMDRVDKAEGEMIISKKGFNLQGLHSYTVFPFISESDDYNQGFTDFSMNEYYFSDPLNRIKKIYPNKSKKPNIYSENEYGSEVFQEIQNGTLYNVAYNKNTTIDSSGVKTVTLSHPLGLKMIVKRETAANSNSFITASISENFPLERKSVITDAEGKSTTFYFDTLGRKIASLRPDMDSFPAISHPELGLVTEEWEYDPDSGLLRKFRDSNLAHENKHIWFKSYDSFGRLREKEIRTDSGGFITGTWTGTHYDTYSDAGACQIAYGEMINSPRRNDELMSQYITRANGKLTCVAEPGFLRTILFYDNNGLLGEKHVAYGKATNPDFQHHVFEYYYNDAGELIEKTIDPVTGKKVAYEYNRLGQIENVYIKSSENIATQIAHLTYKPDGQVNTLIRTLNGVKTTYGYDDLKRLNLIKNEGIASSQYGGFNRFFEYDNLSRITMIYNGTSNLAPSDPIWMMSEYDSFGRLKKGWMKGSIDLNKRAYLYYDYDNAGNRTYFKEWDGSYDTKEFDYGYEAGTNRLTNVYLHNSNYKAHEFPNDAYDHNGNITLKKTWPNPLDGQNLTSTSYAYNLFGHLTDITLPDDEDIDLDPEHETYEYNSAGQRIKKIDKNGKTFIYIYEGNEVVFDRQISGFTIGDVKNDDNDINVCDLVYMVNFTFRGGPAPMPMALADVNDDNAVNIADLVYMVNFVFKGGPAPVQPAEPITLDTVYLNVGGIRLLSIPDSQSESWTYNIKYYLTDQIGSSSVILDKDGNEIARQEYYPFGKTFASHGDVTKYQFTGKENDKTTGLYYYGARYYNPEIGRFMARDTVDDGPSPYAYVHNNPLIATDPTGHASGLFTNSGMPSLALAQESQTEYGQSVASYVERLVMNRRYSTCTTAAGITSKWLSRAGIEHSIVVASSKLANNTYLGHAYVEAKLDGKTNYLSWGGLFSSREDVFAAKGDIRTDRFSLSGYKSFIKEQWQKYAPDLIKGKGAFHSPKGFTRPVSEKFAPGAVQNLRYQNTLPGVIGLGLQAISITAAVVEGSDPFVSAAGGIELPAEVINYMYPNYKQVLPGIYLPSREDSATSNSSNSMYNAPDRLHNMQQ